QYAEPQGSKLSPWYVTALTNGGGSPSRPLTTAWSALPSIAMDSSPTGSNPSDSARNTSSSSQATSTAGRSWAFTAILRSSVPCRSTASSSARAAKASAKTSRSVGALISSSTSAVWSTQRYTRWTG